MRVLHIVNGNDNGGATTQVSTLISSQIKKNEIFVLCLNNGKITQILDDMGVEYKVIDWSIFSLYEILMYVIDKAQDGFVIHAHGLKPMIIVGLFKIFTGTDLNICTTATIHSNYHEEYRKKYLAKLLAIPVFINVSKALNRIIVVSKEFENVLVADGVDGDKIVFIENGINLIAKRQVLDKETFLKSKNINILDEKTTVFGMVARIHPIKGIDVLIDSCDIINTLDYIVLIAGNGDEELVQKYKKDIKDKGLENKVKFLGYIQNIGDFYNAIDVNLISSYSEALSYALLEAAYHGKSVVSTEVVGLKSVLKDSYDSFIVPVGDSEKFALAMKRFIDDDSLCDIMGARLKAKISELYNADRMSLKYDDVYKMLLGAKDANKQ